MKSILTIVVLIICFGAYAQDPKHTIIDKSNGLPSNTIYDIFQDSKGYMWFTCDKGLVKYDGFEFKTFSNQQQSSKSGTNIKEDVQGRIWYQNFDGYVFYIEDDSLLSFKQNAPIGYYNYGIVDNHLFLMQQKGVDVYELTNLKLKKTISLNTAIVSSCINDNNCYYVVDNEGTSCIEKKLSLHRLNNNSLFKKGSGLKILNVKSKLLVYQSNPINDSGVYASQKNDYQKVFNLKLSNIQNASFTESKYWFCTNTGVLCSDTFGTVLNNQKKYFENYNISYVLKDREGNFWFSTINSGLLFVKDIDARLYLSTSPLLKSFLIKDDLYVGNSVGEVQKISLHSLKSETIFKSKLNPEISTLYVDSVLNQIIISNRFLEFVGETHASLKPMNGAIKDVRLIDSNYYAIALSGSCGLLQIDKNKKDIWSTFFNKHKQDDESWIQFLPGCRSKTIEYNAEQKTMYYGTSYGLYAVTPNVIKEIKLDTSRIFANKLCKYKNTIYGLSVNNEIFTIINNEVKKLPFNFYDENEKVGLLKICGHHLVLITNKTIYTSNLIQTTALLIPQNNINYDVSDVEIWNDKLILLSKSGVIIEKLKTGVNQNSNPLLYINTILVNHESYFQNNLKEFSSDQNNIEIAYSILSFKTDFNFPLYFKINDHNWELASSQSRSLKLSSLSPGHYIIQFKLGDLNNTNYKTQRIEFTINKPYWQTWWFMFLCILIIIICVLLFAKWRINELKQKNKLLHEKFEHEQKSHQSILKAIRAQMNPHFFYNALNTIQSFIYSDDKRNAATYLAKFSKLTRLILEMSEKESNTITEEINALQLYLDIEKVRFNDDFEYQIISSDDLNGHETNIPPMLIQPYVENAIKHGLLHKKGHKTLMIEFLKQNSSIVISIDDNGVGRKTSMELNEKKLSKHQSFATAANKQRLDILNKNLENTGVEIIDKLDKNQQSLGTKVVLRIPIINRN